MGPLKAKVLTQKKFIFPVQTYLSEFLTNTPHVLLDVDNFEHPGKKISFKFLPYRHPPVGGSDCPFPLWWSGETWWVCWSWFQSGPRVFRPDGSKAPSCPSRLRPRLFLSHFGVAQASLLGRQRHQNQLDLHEGQPWFRLMVIFKGLLHLWNVLPMGMLYRCVCALDTISPAVFIICLCLTDSKFACKVNTQKKLILLKYRNK